MTAEMTREGLRREARAIRERQERNEEFAKCATMTVLVIGGLALLFAFAAMKRAERNERDSLAAMEYGRYEMVAAGIVNGGAK